MTEILIPRTYTSRDPDAPVLDTTDRSTLIDVLQACLVDGYSSGPTEKESLGWESSLNSSENKAVFRPTDEGSNRIWLHVDATQGGTGTNHVFTRGYETFTEWDVDDIVGTGLFGDGHFFVGRLDSLGVRDWLLLGTSRCFYLWIGADGDPNNAFEDSVFNRPQTDSYGWCGTVHFFGDLGPYPTGYNTALFQSIYTLTTANRPGIYTPMGRPNVYLSQHRVCRNPDGEYLNRVCFLSSAMMGNSISHPIGGSSMYKRYPDPIWGLPMVRGIVSSERSSISFQGDMVGLLPGVHVPLVRIAESSSSSPMDYLEIVEVNGVNLQAYPVGSGSTSIIQAALLFQSDTPWYSQ